MDYLGIPGLLEPDQVRDLLAPAPGRPPRRSSPPARTPTCPSDHATSSSPFCAGSSTGWSAPGTTAPASPTASSTPSCARRAADRPRRWPAPTSCRSGSTGSATGRCADVLSRPGRCRSAEPDRARLATKSGRRGPGRSRRARGSSGRAPGCRRAWSSSSGGPGRRPGPAESDTPLCGSWTSRNRPSRSTGRPSSSGILSVARTVRTRSATVRLDPRSRTRTRPPAVEGPGEELGLLPVDVGRPRPRSRSRPGRQGRQLQRGAVEPAQAAGRSRPGRGRPPARPTRQRRTASLSAWTRSRSGGIVGVGGHDEGGGGLQGGRVVHVHDAPVASGAGRLRQRSARIVAAAQLLGQHLRSPIDVESVSTTPIAGRVESTPEPTGARRADRVVGHATT